MFTHFHPAQIRLKRNWLIARNTGLLGIANVIDRLIAFVIVIAIGRELGVLEFGRYSLGVALATIVFQVSSLGVDVILKRDVSREHSLLAHYFGNAFPIEIVSVSVGILMVAAFSKIAGYEAATVWVLVGISVVFALDTLILLTFAVYEAYEQMGYELIIIVLRVLLLASLPIVLAAGYGLRGIIVAWTVNNIGRLGIALWLVRRRFAAFRLQVDLHFWKQLIKEAYPLAFALLFNVIYYRIDAVMLSFYRGEAEVGIYNAAYSFLNVGGVLSVAFLRSIFPRFAQQSRDPKRLSQTFYRSLAVMALAGVGLAVGVTLFANQLISFAFTSNFASSADALVILGWAGFFMFLSSTCGVLLNATGRQKVSMYVTAAMAIVNVLLNLWLLPLMGYIGASWVTLISYLLGWIVMSAIIIRDFRRPEYLIALSSSAQIG